MNWLKSFRPSVPPVALLLEPPKLLALRVAQARRDLTPLVQHEDLLAGSLDQIAASPEAADSVAGGVLTRLGEPKRISILLGDAFYRTQILTLTEFPRGETERQQVILWHLRKTLNTPMEGVRLRYQILEKTPGAISVWLTMCADDLLKNIEEAFGRRGCQVGYLGSSSVELFNLCLAKDVAPKDGPFLMINRTPSTISFLFADGSRPIFFRSKETAPDEDGDELGRISQELRLTLAYYREKLGRGSLSKIVVRRYPQGVSLPLEDVVEEGTRVEEIDDVLPPLPGNRRRTPEWLPLFGLLEGA